MKERRGTPGKWDRMTATEARERIKRFRAGGNLFDFSNWYLGIDDLRLICNSLVYATERVEFLLYTQQWAKLQPDTHKLFSREYKLIRRKANQLRRAIEDADPLLF